MPVTQASLNLTFGLTSTFGGGSFGTPSFLASLVKLFSFGSTGNGANKFRVGYVADRTVTTGTPDVLDLTNGSLLEPDGITPATFRDVLMLGIYNNSTTTGQIITAGGGANDLPTIAQQQVKPGQLHFIGGPTAIGIPIVDTVTIDATGGTFTISVTAGGVTDTTTAIAYNATAATVQTAIQALGNVGSNLATVTGSTGGPYTISIDPSLGAWSITTGAGSLTGGGGTAAVVSFHKISVNVAAGTSVSYSIFAIGH